MVVVAVTSAPLTAELRGHIASMGPEAILAFEDGAIQAAFGVDRYPTYYLIDAEGTIVCARCTLDDIEPMIASRRTDL